MQKIASEIRDFIEENFPFGRKDLELRPEDSFLRLGVVDSTGVLEIVAYIETRYDFRVEDEELIPENFDSIVNLTRYIQGKLT